MKDKLNKVVVSSDLYRKFSKKDFKNNCFSPNWLEVNLEDANRQVTKEERLESKRRKDLKTFYNLLDETLMVQKVLDDARKFANMKY